MSRKSETEKIKDHTQIFTPQWVIQYMVENSLGRFWVEGHPNKAMRDTWRYYLDEAKQEPEVTEKLHAIWAEHAKLRPEEITVMDPCMGTGLILDYAFDVMMQIYESEGWDPAVAARSILENNLHGIDIDYRVTQIAIVRMLLKARRYDKMLLAVPVRHNILCIRSSRTIPQELIDYIGNTPELREIMQKHVDDFKDADILGSVIIPETSEEEVQKLRERMWDIKDDIKAHGVPEELKGIKVPPPDPAEHLTDAPEDFLIWLASNRPEKADLEKLHRDVDDWVRMMTQSTAGQPQYNGKEKRVKKDICIREEMERVRMNLLFHGISLVMSGQIDQIDCDGPMEPIPIVDKEKMKDPERRALTLREQMYGVPFDPPVLRSLVMRCVHRWDMAEDNRRNRLDIITETLAIALSGRLGKETT